MAAPAGCDPVRARATNDREERRTLDGGRYECRWCRPSGSRPRRPPGRSPGGARHRPPRSHQRLAELGIERLLLSDPDLDAVIIDRELGKLLADPRMGEELVATLQTYFDCGYNRRETARRLHLADRTVAYRLERAEDLLGHGLEGDAGRRLNVALTIRRLGGAGSRRLTRYQEIEGSSSPASLLEPDVMTPIRRTHSSTSTTAQNRRSRHIRATASERSCSTHAIADGDGPGWHFRRSPGRDLRRFLKSGTGIVAARARRAICRSAQIGKRSLAESRQRPPAQRHELPMDLHGRRRGNAAAAASRDSAR